MQDFVHQQYYFNNCYASFHPLTRGGSDRICCNRCLDGSRGVVLTDHARDFDHAIVPILVGIYVYINNIHFNEKVRCESISFFWWFFERKHNCALDYSWITDSSFFTSMHDSVVFLYLSHFVLSLLKLQLIWLNTCRQIPKTLYCRRASGFSNLQVSFATATISIRQRDINNNIFFGRWAFRGAGKSAMAKKLSRVGFWVPVWVREGSDGFYHLWKSFWC